MRNIHNDNKSFPLQLDNEKKYATELEQELEELMSKFAEQKEEEEEDAIDYELVSHFTMKNNKNNIVIIQYNTKTKIIIVALTP